MTETDYAAIKDRAQLRSCRRVVKIQAEAKAGILMGRLEEARSYYTPGRMASMVIGKAASSFSWATVLLPAIRALRKRLG